MRMLNRRRSEAATCRPAPQPGQEDTCGTKGDVPRGLLTPHFPRRRRGNRRHRVLEWRPHTSKIAPSLRPRAEGDCGPRLGAAGGPRSLRSALHAVTRLHRPRVTGKRLNKVHRL